MDGGAQFVGHLDLAVAQQQLYRVARLHAHDHKGDHTDEKDNEETLEETAGEVEYHNFGFWILD
jgi:hypothetical protein